MFNHGPGYTCRPGRALRGVPEQPGDILLLNGCGERVLWVEAVELCSGMWYCICWVAAYVSSDAVYMGDTLFVKGKWVRC